MGPDRRTTTDFARYLLCKKALDDRSLNHHVSQQLMQRLPTGQPLRVLEMGAGIGTMLARLIEGGVLRQAEYTAVDNNDRHLRAMRAYLARWAPERGVNVRWRDQRRFHLQWADGDITATYRVMDVYDFCRRSLPARGWHLLLAHAFMDLVDLRSLLPCLFELAAKDGCLYLTLNYDGETVFLPPAVQRQEQQILALYNRSMDQREVDGRPAGHSQTGRLLLGLLMETGADILAAGSSDWVVHPRAHRYSAEEAFFLQYILETIGQELEGHPELAPASLKRWLEERLAQLRRGELIYMAKQLDILARVPRRGNQRQADGGNSHCAVDHHQGC